MANVYAVARSATHGLTPLSRTGTTPGTPVAPLAGAAPTRSARGEGGRCGAEVLKNSRAVATRYDKRAYVFHGTVTIAAVRLRPRP